MSTIREKAIERLDALDAEAKKLREIINATEQRTPKQGDAWRHINGIYVKVEDVRAALSIEDRDGESIIGKRIESRGISGRTIEETRRALAKLNIK